MKNKQNFSRPFLVSTTLIVLSVLAVLFIGLLVYTFAFYTETQRGLEIYFADTFAIFPFVLIYTLLFIASIILLLSVVLMWMRKKTGLFLYFSWSLAMVLLLLFAKQIDWFSIMVLLVLVVALSLDFSYFSVKDICGAEDDSDSFS